MTETMDDNEVLIERDAVRLDGTYDLAFQSGCVMAYSGTMLAGILPLRQGTCWNWLARLMEPDRFLLRRGSLKGTLWLGSRDCPYAEPLKADSSVFVRSDALLCVSLAQRIGGSSLRLVPGSARNAMALTEVRTDGPLAPFVCTASPLCEASLDDGETLHVSPSAFVAWSGCAKPKAFCARMRLRDLFLPRLPETLTLDFRGPGRVWFQGAARSAKAKPSRRQLW